MWKKSDQPYPESLPVQSAGNRTPVTDQAVIGPSITIKGDLVGNEDLLIEGTVNGTVTLKQYQITVGKNGKIHANIFAKMIQVEGQVIGDLEAEQQVIIRQSGSVTGNIKAPKVALEEGCLFKGSIDMDKEGGRGPSPKKASSPQENAAV